jgi:hypothetical protein
MSPIHLTGSLPDRAHEIDPPDSAFPEVRAFQPNEARSFAGKNPHVGIGGLFSCQMSYHARGSADVYFHDEVYGFVFGDAGRERFLALCSNHEFDDARFWRGGQV